MRDQLAAELGEINSTDEAANWAHRVLGAKNSLTAADAACIEEAFRAKLAIFATDTADGPEIPQETKRPQTQSRSDRGKKQRRSSVIDKSMLALPEPRRVRDREHVRYVTQQSCLICGRRPSDAHHLRFAQSRALSRKVSDEFTVPHSMYLLQVKAPDESKDKWDVFKMTATIPAEQAFRPLDQGGCPLVSKQN